MAHDHDDTAASAPVVALTGTLDAYPPPIYRELAHKFGISTGTTDKIASMSAGAQKDTADQQ